MDGDSNEIVIKKPKKDKTALIIRCIYIPIIIALAALNGYLFWENSKPVDRGTLTVPVISSGSTTNSAAKNQTSLKLVTDAGVTWQEPVEIGSANLLKEDPNGMYSISDAKYYKIATLADGGSIVLVKMPYGMGSTAMLRFRQDSSGKYYYLTKNSTITDATEIANTINAVDDNTTVYGSISSPDVISSPEGISFKKGWDNDFYSLLSSPTKVAETIYGYIYRTTRVEDKENPSIITRSFYLKHADGTVTSYTMTELFMSDNGIPAFKFTDGIINKDSYVKHLSASCGIRGGNSIAADSKAIALLLNENGTAANDKIYSFKDSGSTLFQSIYNFYKVGRDNNVLTIDQFLGKNPVTVWKDSFGDYNLYLNSNYGALAECGKPVVYLYPKKDTPVTVKVGADITKSEPPYNNGWTALAKPNGELKVGGATFPYLYWEGQGKGIYPDIDAGFIVKKENIEATLKDHLSKLGLNAKESADFMDFWLPKMPSTPYVRLTWFGTAEMNRLAPLEINPKPDTLIRIFLDFQGVNNAYPITPQKLSSVKRIGFTAVEWGGLLK